MDVCVCLFSTKINFFFVYLSSIFNYTFQVPICIIFIKFLISVLTECTKQSKSIDNSILKTACHRFNSTAEKQSLSLCNRYRVTA